MFLQINHEQTQMGKKPCEFIQNGKHLSHNEDLILYQRTKNTEQCFVQSNKEYKERGKAFHETAVVIPYNQAYIGQSPCEHNESDKTFCSNSTLMVSRMAQRTENMSLKNMLQLLRNHLSWNKEFI